MNNNSNREIVNSLSPRIQYFDKNLVWRLYFDGWIKFHPSFKKSKRVVEIDPLGDSGGGNRKTLFVFNDRTSIVI